MTMMMTSAPVADSKAEAMAVNSVRMAAELEARLVAAAGQLRMSKSDVIRQALAEFLARQEALAVAQFVEELGELKDQDQVQWEDAQRPLASVA
ncbi:MAG: hypothetical protein K0Q68_1563 [Moraxellaceae bacterium]|jgi:predicted transcriptional regulator|nr:hypothetical protein [Moraxellaceae bacterium]